MRPHLILICFVIFSYGSQRQTSYTDKIIPPGTVAINDTLFADIKEIANADWLEYRSYLLDVKKDTPAWKAAHLDTTVWGDISDMMQAYYSDFRGLWNYPALGMTHEQALKYCEWRTHAANQFIYFKKEKLTKNKKWKAHINDPFPIHFIYRLPTEQEWEMIASGGLDKNQFPFGSTFAKYTMTNSFNSKNYGDSLRAVMPGGSSEWPVKVRETTSFPPNNFGLYDVIGNLAEMVAEKGISKGGSFMDSLDNSAISKRKYYTKPEEWLGFRCVAVKVK